MNLFKTLNRALLAVFIVIIGSTCNPSTEKLETLDLIINRLSEENARLINSISIEIKKKGERKADVIIFNKVVELLKLRKEFDIPGLTDSLCSENLAENILGYMAEVVKLAEKEKVKTKAEFAKRANAIFNHYSSGEEYDNRILMLNLLLFESDFLDKIAQEIGGSCWIDPVFNLNVNEDTATVGQSYEAILSLAEPESDAGKFKFENINVTLGDESIEFVSKEYGNALMIQFTPIKAGEYRIEGNAFVNYDIVDTDFSYKIDCRVEARE